MADIKTRIKLQKGLRCGLFTFEVDWMCALMIDPYTALMA